jgi:hypothetical protein
VRQHAVAALNLTQQAKQLALGGAEDDGEKSPNTLSSRVSASS